MNTLPLLQSHCNASHVSYNVTYVSRNDSCHSCIYSYTSYKLNHHRYNIRCTSNQSYHNSYTSYSNSCTSYKSSYTSFNVGCHRYNAS